MVLGLTPGQFQSLIRATGTVEAVEALETERNLDFRREADRWKARHEISAILEPWFAARPLGDIAQVLDAAGALWSPYRSFQQVVLEDRRLQAGAADDLVGLVEHPGIGTYATVASPIRFSASGAATPRRSPQLGEHTAEVLAELSIGRQPS